MLHRQAVYKTFATSLLLACAMSAGPVQTSKAVAQTIGLESGKATISASDRLNQPGPEARALSMRAGLWDLTETVWASPGASPVVSQGLVAERRMMGALLQEVIRPSTDRATDEVKRTDLLSYNRVEGRWDYASFDTRAPVGLMSAWSANSGDGAKIELSFAPFAVPGPGSVVAGQMLRMEQEIRFLDLDHDVKDQYFALADGTGVRWLAHRYEYARRK